MTVETFLLQDGPILVLNLSKPTEVAGFGGHVSTSERSDGFGGRHPELYFRSGTVRRPGRHLELHLWEGHDPATDDLHHFRVDLGPKEDLEGVQLLVRRDHVEVDWARLTRNRNEARQSYHLNAFLPFSRASRGFWRDDPPRVFFRRQGVLSGRSGREGTGCEGLTVRLWDGLDQGPREASGGMTTGSSTNTGAGTGSSGGGGA